MRTSEAVTLLAAAGGSFVGAAAAFLLEALRRRREETNARYSALLKTQVVLWSQLDSLLSLQKLHLDAVRHEPQRFLLLPRLHMSASESRVDFGSLWFLPLLEDVELIARLNIAEQGYLTTFGGLEMTNRLIEELSSLAKVVDGQFDFESGIARVEVDARRARVLKGAVDGLYDSCDASIEDHKRALANIECVMKREWPKRRALHLAGVCDASEEQACQGAGGGDGGVATDPGPSEAQNGR